MNAVSDHGFHIASILIGLAVVVLSGMILNGYRQVKKNAACDAALNSCSIGGEYKLIEITSILGIIVGSVGILGGIGLIAHKHSPRLQSAVSRVAPSGLMGGRSLYGGLEYYEL